MSDVFVQSVIAHVRQSQQPYDKALWASVPTTFDDHLAQQHRRTTAAVGGMRCVSVWSTLAYFVVQFTAPPKGDDKDGGDLGSTPDGKVQDGDGAEVEPGLEQTLPPPLQVPPVVELVQALLPFVDAEREAERRQSAAGDGEADLTGLPLMTYDVFLEARDRYAQGLMLVFTFLLEHLPRAAAFLSYRLDALYGLAWLLEAAPALPTAAVAALRSHVMVAMQHPPAPTPSDTAKEGSESNDDRAVGDTSRDTAAGEGMRRERVVALEAFSHLLSYPCVLGDTEQRWLAASLLAELPPKDDAAWADTDAWTAAVAAQPTRPSPTLLDEAAFFTKDDPPAETDGAAAAASTPPRAGREVPEKSASPQTPGDVDFHKHDDEDGGHEDELEEGGAGEDVEPWEEAELEFLLALLRHARTAGPAAVGEGRPLVTGPLLATALWEARIVAAVTRATVVLERASACVLDESLIDPQGPPPLPAAVAAGRILVAAAEAAPWLHLFAPDPRSTAWHGPFRKAASVLAHCAVATAVDGGGVEHPAAVASHSMLLAALRLAVLFGSGDGPQPGWLTQALAEHPPLAVGRADVDLPMLARRAEAAALAVARATVAVMQHLPSTEAEGNTTPGLPPAACLWPLVTVAAAEAVSTAALPLLTDTRRVATAKLLTPCIGAVMAALLPAPSAPGIGPGIGIGLVEALFVERPTAAAPLLAVLSPAAAATVSTSVAVLARYLTVHLQPLGAADAADIARTAEGDAAAASPRTPLNDAVVALVAPLGRLASLRTALRAPAAASHAEHHPARRASLTPGAARQELREAELSALCSLADTVKFFPHRVLADKESGDAVAACLMATVAATGCCDLADAVQPPRPSPSKLQLSHEDPEEAPAPAWAAWGATEATRLSAQSYALYALALLLSKAVTSDVDDEAGAADAPVVSWASRCLSRQAVLKGLQLLRRFTAAALTATAVPPHEVLELVAPLPMALYCGCKVVAEFSFLPAADLVPLVFRGAAVLAAELPVLLEDDPLARTAVAQARDLANIVAGAAHDGENGHGAAFDAATVAAAADLLHAIEVGGSDPSQ